MKIDYELKRKCVELANQDINRREIYDNVFYPQHDTMSYNTFCRKLRYWRNKSYVDNRILNHANLNWEFTPYAATVQTDGKGKIVQTWVKQAADNRDFELLLEEIRKNTPPVKIKCSHSGESGRMLEIPLYDLHIGIADLEWYSPVIAEIIEIIKSRKWQKILIPIAQDLFHNDDFRGRTSSGRQIEKVDMIKAWKDAKTIYYTIGDCAFKNAVEVEFIYVPSNHDESMSWAFSEMLAERYGKEHVDNIFQYKKVRTFGKNFIGFVHGNGKKSNPRDLRGQFTIKFPVEFANAKVREIHAGHLHTEYDSDEYGVMCRRLSSGNKQDDWSDKEGYEGSHKRFMLFEWSEEKLAAIHYV